MRNLGYIEGKNLAFEMRYAEGKRERYPPLAAELVRLKPDVIVAYGNDATDAARKTTTTIPIVMAPVQDAVAAGIVTNLAHLCGATTS